MEAPPPAAPAARPPTGAPRGGHLDVSQKEGKGGIGVVGALSIGIGGIVGGGFFATFGMAVVGSRGSTWISFLVGGALALLTAYAYLRLTLRYPGPAGTVGFIRQGFGEELARETGSRAWISAVAALATLGALAVMICRCSRPPRRDRPPGRSWGSWSCPPASPPGRGSAGGRGSGSLSA